MPEILSYRHRVARTAPNPRSRLIRRYVVGHGGDRGDFASLQSALAWISEHPGQRVTLTSYTHWDGARSLS
jgi:hypothetical protein